ncbi:MAG: phytanoyl-CoA dioxygenase family protein, partial [Bryobacteraceae bacterium]
TGNSLTVEDPRAAAFEETPVEVRRGACVLHSCLTAHRSEPNLSTQPRRGLIYVYMSPRVELTEGAKLRGINWEFAEVS